MRAQMSDGDGAQGQINYVWSDDDDPGKVANDYGVELEGLPYGQ